MATSGSYDFSVNGTTLMTASMRVLGVVDPDETPTAKELANCREALNMMIKSWMVNPNFMQKGFHVWQRQRQTIDTSVVGLAQSYTLGPSQTVDMQLPVRVLGVTMVDANNNRTVLNPMSLADYENIGDYTDTGTPTEWFYERGTTTGTLYLDKTPTDNTKDFIILYVRPIQDMDANTDDFEFPQEWYRALKFNLAVEIASEFGRDASPIIPLAMQSLEIANSVVPESDDTFFEPERY